MNQCKGTDFAEEEFGGWGRIRTGVHGFAGRCITTLLPSHFMNKKGSACLPLQSGAGNEARTRDLNLGKVALYQLSYSRVRTCIVSVAAVLSSKQAVISFLFSHLRFMEK